MAAEVDLFSFLKMRNIPDSVINQLQDDKIDINVIGVMTDEELSQYIVRYGDRLAAAKVTRRVEMGWLHFESGTYHQVRTRKGGGTQNLSVQKSVTMGELVETGKGLFFPNGHSSKGPMEDFKFDICDYSHNFVPHEVTVGQLYEQTKLRMLRIYATTKVKDIILLSDESSDFEPTHKRLMKARTMKTRSLRNKTRRRHQVDHPESSSDLDLAPSGSMQKNHEKRGETISQSRSATPEMGNTEVLHPRPSDDVGSHTQQSTRRHGSEDDCLKPVPNQDADQLFKSQACSTHMWSSS